MSDDTDYCSNLGLVFRLTGEEKYSECVGMGAEVKMKQCSERGEEQKRSIKLYLFPVDSLFILSRLLTFGLIGENKKTRESS